MNQQLAPRPAVGLSKFVQPLVQHLRPALRETVAALLDHAQPVGKLDPALVQAHLIAWLTGALFSLNHGASYKDGEGDAPGQTVELLAAEVARMIQRRFSTFKPKEVQEAIRRGSAGDYHNPAQGFLVVSVPNVASWLSAYAAADRREALALLAQAEATFAREGAPMDLPVWHPVKFGLNVAELCDTVRRALLPAGYNGADLGDFSLVLYDYLGDLGVWVAWAGLDRMKEILDQEAAALAAIPTTYAQDVGRRGELRSFADALKTEAAHLAKHPVMSEAKNNARRRLYREFIVAQDSPRAAYLYVLNAWATRYFSHYAAQQ